MGDYILNNVDKFYKAPEVETGKSAAIVGAGPSGLAAAYYLRQSGVKVTIYDKMPEAGGMLMYAIPHYRTSKDICKTVYKSLRNYGS